MYKDNRGSYICSDCEIKCESWNPKRCKDYKFRCENCLIKYRKICAHKLYVNTPNKKDKNLRHHHGITEHDWNKMFNNQNGLCAICKKSDVYLVVDHNHFNGKIRGLLCRPCNQILGCALDKPEILYGAISYLSTDGVNCLS